MDLRGKTVVVTGGASGLGHELCRLFMKRGAVVHSLDISTPHIKVLGVHYHKVDVTSSRSITKFFKKIKEIDVLVNNAGVMKRGNILDSSEKDFDFLHSINIKGVWLMTRLAHEKFSKNPVIINISSRHGTHPVPDPGVYSLTKRWVLGFSELLQKTYPNFLVKVAAPGPMNTKVAVDGVPIDELEQKLKIMSEPEEIAALILELFDSKHSRLVFDESNNKYYFS